MASCRVTLPAWLPVALLLVGHVSAAERPWVEAKSDHFTAVSEGDEKTARRVAWQFEQMRAAMQSIWPWARVDLDRPMLVLTARDEAGMKALAPGFWEQRGGPRPESVSVTGVDRHYVALRSDVEAADRLGTINPYQAAYWSYVATVINASFARDLPLWFVRGMAGVLSNTLVRDSYVEVGRPLPWYLQAMRQGSRLSLRELTAVDRNSPWYQQSDRLGVFDAQSWAFVHFLMFSDSGAHLSQLNRFASLLAEGRPAGVALELGLGNLDTLEAAFRTYFNKDVFQYSKINADQKIRRETFQARALSPADSASLRAALHVALKRTADARILIEAARKAEPRSAASYDVEGVAFDLDGKPNEARAAFDKAIELGSGHYYTYYRWSALTWSTRPDAAQVRTKVEELLGKSTEMNGGFAPAYALLSDVKTQLGHPDEGLKMAERAVALDSGGLGNRLALARALWSASRRDEARREARGALSLAKNDAERQIVNELVTFFERN